MDPRLTRALEEGQQMRADAQEGKRIKAIAEKDLEELELRAWLNPARYWIQEILFHKITEATASGHTEIILNSGWNDCVEGWDGPNRVLQYAINEVDGVTCRTREAPINLAGKEFLPELRDMMLVRWV